MINLSIDPPRRFLPLKILHRHVSRRRRFHHRSVHVVRYRQCCFCPASRSRGCALPPLASRRLRRRLAGAVAIAVFLSRPRDGGAALCPLLSATRSRLQRCVARLASIVDCWVCVGGTALCPLSFAVHRRRWRGVLCLMPLPATAPGPNSVAGVNFALGLPRASEKNTIFGHPYPVLQREALPPPSAWLVVVFHVVQWLECRGAGLVSIELRLGPTRLLDS